MKSAMKKTGAKAMKATKAMKAMKSRIARGKLAKAQVFRGRREKTAGGLKASDIIRNKFGRLVSKKRSALGKNLPWPKAIAAARKALGITGFVVINRGPEGKALYAKAKAILAV